MTESILDTTTKTVLNGRVIVWADVPTQTYEPIAIYSRDLKRENYVTTCTIEFSRAGHKIAIPKGFVFDGASIPRMFWGIKGFSPTGTKLWAALLHDYLCVEAANKPDTALPLVIGDAIFVATLLDTGEETWRAVVMYLAVRAHHTWPSASKWCGTIARGGWRTVLYGAATGGVAWLGNVMVEWMR